MICATERMAAMARKAYPPMEKRILGPNPETLQGLSHESKIIVDNAEVLIACILGRPIHGATMTARGKFLDTNPFLTHNRKPNEE